MQQQQQQQYYFSSNNPNPINSNNNINNNNSSIFYPENDITNNINSFSKLDDDNSNNIDDDDDNPACSSNNFLHFNNFPNSPQMLEYESVYLQFYDLFHQQPQSENTPNNMVITTTDLNHENDVAAPDAAKTKSKTTTKGRCSKKDRHSKIITASGPRDRRMRLSLDVARRFFQLQDTLGYDKASRTVDWLLNSSRDAIKELLKRDGRSRSTSSSITESIYDQDQVVSSEKKKTTQTKTKTKTKKNNNNKLAAGVVRGAVGKESRQKARERARERTSQKKRLHMMTKNSTSTSATTTFNEERIDDDHHVTATRGDENNTNTWLFCTAGLGPWNINTSTSVFGENATWNL